MQPTVSPVAEALNHQGDYSVLAQQHPPVFHPSCSAHRPVSNISRQSRVVCRPHQLKPAGLTDVNAASCVQQCHAIPECRGSSPLPKKEISLDLCKSHESSLRRVGPPTLRGLASASYRKWQTTHIPQLCGAAWSSC